MEDHPANRLAQFELLKMRIEGNLKAYEGILKGYEQDLKQYVKDDLHYSLIKVQETMIIKLKAKIEVLTDLKK